ncbi:MAG: SdiA-regulated domain-containing protein [Bacteroidales bacterium]|nr:SdiA-regulated domain-containing protein [Bacteroidales bacterium]
MKTSIYKIAILIFLPVLFQTCKKDEPSSNLSLNLISQSQVPVFEASGLSVYKPGQLLTVSDSLNEVYVINLTGQILKTLNYKGDNLEGVAYFSANSDIFIVEENLGEIVHLDSSGLEKNRFAINLDNQFEKHGLEGITYNPDNGHLYAISEKWPSLLFELTLNGELTGTYELDFAQDYSSVFYEPVNKVLWILSDESKTLTKCTLKGKPLLTYDTGIKKGEGVVVDQTEHLIYLVTDNESILYVFSYEE